MGEVDRPSLNSLDDIQRAALTDALTDIERHHEADVLGLFGPMLFTIEDRVRLAIESIDSRPHESRRNKLLVVLDTLGGTIETAERVVLTLRHFYPDHVGFVIPDRAMSAGTILAMSGDEIWMDYYSCLGPVDPQVPQVEAGGASGTRLVPAIAYLEQYARLQELAAQGELTQADAILLSKLDLAELRRFELERDRSVTLIQDWLARYKFKTWTRTESRAAEVTDEVRRERAEAIAIQLQDLGRWGSHNRGIPMQVLTDELNLRIDDYSADAVFHSVVRRYFGLMRQLVPPTTDSSFVHSRTFI